jgi:iron complex outermembrane receptor protein
MKFNNHLQILLTLSVFSLLLAASAAVAQSDQEAEMAGMLEEVIVTATKREESVMLVPISISTLSEETLNVLTASGDDIRFLRGRVPSLNIESSFGRLFPRFYIRGWGNTDFDINASQPVSLVYDEVVQENPILKGFPIFDTELIEVLRGPQGTLFGRNTPAGVVHVRSKRPTQEQDGYAQLSLGSDDINFEGAFGGGLSENWSTRISVKYSDRDDWVTNVLNPSYGDSRKFGGHRETAFRAQLLYDGDSFSALANVHYRDLEGTARLFRANIYQPGIEGTLIPGFQEKTISIDGRNDQEMEQWGGVLRLEWDLDNNSTITSITGYETFDSWSVGDIDGGWGGAFVLGYGGPGFLPFDAETGDGVSDHDQITQEIRWATNDWGRVDWTLGLFYFDESVDIYTFNYATLFGGGVNGDVTQSQENEAWALFGSVDFDFTDDLVGRFGLRFSNDEKDYVAQRFLSPLAFQGVPDELGPIPASVEDEQISWDASVTRYFDDDTSAYVRVAKGFRAPSIQGRILFGDIVSIADSEIVYSYEFGVKSAFDDGRGRIAGNVFYYDVDDVQLTAVGGETNFNRAINAEEMVGMGFEIDGEYLITDNFLLSAAFSYNKTELNDPDLSVQPCGAPGGCTVEDPVNPDRPGTVLIDGNPMPQAPRMIFAANARYGIPTDSGEWYVIADYFWRDEVNFFLYESREFTGQDYGEWGLRTGLAFGDGRYDVSLFVRNLTDEIVGVGAIDFNNLTGFVNEPRRYGVQARVNFF